MGLPCCIAPVFSEAGALGFSLFTLPRRLCRYAEGFQTKLGYRNQLC